MREATNFGRCSLATFPSVDFSFFSFFSFFSPVAAFFVRSAACFCAFL
jgi:hypothetical protein